MSVKGLKHGHSLSSDQSLMGGGYVPVPQSQRLFSNIYMVYAGSDHVGLCLL